MLATSASAQYRQPAARDLDGQFTPEVLERSREVAKVDEKLGDQLPLDAVFTDSSGRQIAVGDLFDGERPVLIQFAYYSCPVLCGEVMNGMVRSMRTLEDELTPGDDFRVVTLSFDSRESVSLAADNKKATVRAMDGSFAAADVEAGWSFLVGDDANIETLTQAAGFNFGWIEEAQEYSHPAVLVLATPDGRVSRYLYGVEYDPQALRLSIIDASDGNLRPSLNDAFVFYCFNFDPSTGKYTATARTVMMFAGGATVLTLGFVVAFLVVAERRGRLGGHPMKGTPMPDDEDDLPPPSADASRPRGAFTTGA
jgi:protein SCO1/2